MPTGCGFTRLAINAKKGSAMKSYAHIGRSLLAGSVLLPPTVEGAGRFVQTGALHQPRVAHTATLLSNGQVLVCGGGDGSAPLNSAEVYDPAEETFTLVGNLAAARHSHRAVLLPNGKV